MSDLHPDLAKLLEPLRQTEATDPADPQLSAAARARVLAALETQVKQVPLERARGRRKRAFVLGTSVALAAAASFVLWSSRSTPPDATQTLAVHVVASGTSPLSWTASTGGDGQHDVQQLRAESDLRGTGELVVPTQASAQLTTADGVRMEAAEHTRLSLKVKRQHAEPDVLLRAGVLRCRVPKLGAGHSFVVATERARVVVHGTDFSVHVGGTEAALKDQPCVQVREGLVEVQRAHEASVWLRPGDSWGCVMQPSAAPPAPAPVAQPRATADVAVPAPTAGHGRTRPRVSHHTARRSGRLQASSTVHDTDKTGSTLEQENRLLGLALSAERRGEGGRAHTLFATLLTQYPASVLIPEARAGLERTRKQ